MATTINSSSLDFESIKNNLKTYLEQQVEFKDYDFDAAGLSNLLDVLAYNTHMNALTANFALNESFLSTSQLRSSVVSHAETLGYIPASRTAAQATVNLSFNIGIDQDDVPEKLQISSGYTFTSSVDDASYTFQTQELIEATNDGNNFFQFTTLDGDTNIPVKEGIAKTKTFFAGEDGEEAIYVIPDTNLDRQTAVVKIFESAVSTDFTTYVNLETATNITATTPAYILKEAPNGYFELTFGNGSTLGAVPKAGSKITVEYLSVAGAPANGARVFEPINTVEVTEPTSGVGLQRLPVVSTTSRSAGGAEKETLDSIRRNAPFRYATQNRMVTHVDYANLIKREYGTLINDIIAWGGEDNDVPTFGTAFVSIVFNGDVSTSLQTQTKDNIRVLVDQLSIASFGLQFTDPVKTFVEVNLFFQYNPDYTNLSINALQESVRTTMTNYFASNTGKFGQSFRRSQLLALVDDTNNAILSSRADIKMQQRVSATNVSTDYTLTFPVPITSPDDVNTVVTSDSFIFNGQTCSIKNQLKTATTNGTKLQIIVNETGQVAAFGDNVGSYDAGSGKVNIVGLKIDTAKSIKISVTPANQSNIVPVREYILDIDTTRLNAKGISTSASN
jgi:hypothetical protein